MASRETCFQFAYQLYKIGEDGGESPNNLWQVGETLSLDHNKSQQIADELQREGLLEFLSFEGDVSLTSFGTAAVMQALADKNQATVYFPPVGPLLLADNDGAGKITVNSVNAFVDDLVRQAESMLLDDHEKLELDTGISMLEKYVAAGAGDVRHLSAGLEKVSLILAPDHSLQ